MTQHIKPLPGQMPLFDMPTTDTEEIRRNDEPCAWGDCAEPATHTRHKTGERFCRLHIQWTLSA